MKLTEAKIGVVPIIFANDDLPELTPPIDPETLVGEIVRLGFSGCQLSRALPPIESLRCHGLRIAEVYAALPCTSDGPTAAARELAFQQLERLQHVDGDVLVFSYHLSEERLPWAGRAIQRGAPALTETGRERALTLIADVARQTQEAGKQLAYHPHAGTFVETPDEVQWLMDSTERDLVGLCLDTGHYIVGGGDPVSAVRRFGARVRHVHMKDVDPVVLERLQAATINGFLEALKSRIFTELGGGVLDVLGVLRELSHLNYSGWFMCEQDTTWRPASESSAMSRAVLGYAMRLAEAP